MQEGSEVLSCESPLEGPSDGLVVALEVEDSLRESLQGREVIGREHLALEHGEVDLDLVEPARVYRSVDEYEVGKPSSESAGCGWTAMCAPVVDDPEDSPRFTIATQPHGLGDQTVEARDAVFVFAATEDPEFVDVEGGEVGPGTEPFVLMLDSHLHWRWSPIGRDGEWAR